MEPSQNRNEAIIKGKKCKLIETNASFLKGFLIDVYQDEEGKIHLNERNVNFTNSILFPSSKTENHPLRTFSNIFKRLMLSLRDNYSDKEILRILNQFNYSLKSVKENYQTNYSDNFEKFYNRSIQEKILEACMYAQAGTNCDFQPLVSFERVLQLEQSDNTSFLYEMMKEAYDIQPDQSEQEKNQ